MNNIRKWTYHQHRAAAGFIWIQKRGCLKLNWKSLFGKILTAEFKFLSIWSTWITDDTQKTFFLCCKLKYILRLDFKLILREKWENRANSVQLKAESDYAFTFDVLARLGTLERPDSMKL